MNVVRRMRIEGLNLGIQAYSAYKGLFYWLTPFSYITNVIVRPLLGMVLFTTLASFAFGEPAMQRLAIGIPILASSFIVMSGLTQSYARERNIGTLSLVFSSPTNRFTHFLSRAALHYPNGLISYACGLFMGWLIVGLDFSQVNWAVFLLSLSATVGTLTMFAQMIGVVSIATRDFANLTYPIVNTMTILSGVIIPLSFFPTPVAEFARFLPMVNGLEAMRGAFTGLAFSEVGLGAARELLNGVLYLAMGYSCFALFERAAKRRGTLELEAG